MNGDTCYKCIKLAPRSKNVIQIHSRDIYQVTSSSSIVVGKMKEADLETESRDLYRWLLLLSSPFAFAFAFAFALLSTIILFFNAFQHISFFSVMNMLDFFCLYFYCSNVFVFQCFSTDTLALASCPTASEVVKKAVGEVTFR